ncbi:hypothetical protein GTR00_18780 [Kineococcus sp. T90]|nr:hypothetical protein [Kineococcus indalonis]
MAPLVHSRPALAGCSRSPETPRTTTADTVRTSCSYCGVGCGIVLRVGTDAASGRRAGRERCRRYPGRA